MFTITICEDTLSDTEHLNRLLLEYGQLRCFPLQTHIYHDGESLLSAEMAEPAGNIFLLDAILPGLDGIEVARRLRSSKRQEPILYLTTSRNYAVEAFSVEAINYLLKPISAETLFPALDSAIMHLVPKQVLQFSIQTNIGETTVAASSIIYVEQKRHYLYFHMENGSIIESKCLRVPFETALALLIKQRHFLRPHQSYLINAAHVTKLVPYEFIMDNKTVIPISRLRWMEIRTQYMNYLLHSKQKK